MKKIISLILTVSLMLTMVFTAAVSVSAATAITDVDATKLDRIGVDSDKKISLSITDAENGGFDITISNYQVQLFKDDGTVNTSTLWMKGGIAAVKDSNGNGVVLQGGSKYSINIVYDVTSVGTENATYQPQIGIARNNHSSNIMTDNGTVLYTAKKHSSVGSYSLSYQAAPSGNQPLRLAFGGHGAFAIKSITVKKVSQSYGDASNLDLTNIEPITVSGASFSNFKSATDTTPLSVDVNANYSYNQTLFDGTNTWINNWTVMYLKTLIPLKYDAENYVVLNREKTFKITVKYKVTATSATETKDYPEIGIVRNDGYTLSQDNGSKVIAAQRIAPADVNIEKTLTATIDGSSLNGHPLRLALTGKGSFEILSATIAEYANVATMTLVSDGVSTVDYMAYGTALPTPVKSGFTFMGWFDADGVKYTTVTTSKTLTAAWVKNSDVDLTKAAKIDGTKATMTVDVPAEANAPMNVTVQGFNGLLMDKNNVVKTNKIWTGGASVALKYADDSYVEFVNSSKYIVNVEYDVINIGTYDKDYHPQIAILYNESTYTQDNGQYILAAKKHSAEIENASISCVVNAKNCKALRLAFDGQGSFVIKSVTVTEMSKDTTALKLVTYNDNVYSTSKVAVAEDGSAIADLPRTAAHNFGGWFDAEDNKVVAVSGDTAVSAKWFDKFDVTMDNKIDLLDLVRIKKALADKSEDLVYDIDRDDVVAATDTTSLKKNLLGIKDAPVEEVIAEYTVVTGDQKSF